VAAGKKGIDMITRRTVASLLCLIGGLLTAGVTFGQGVDAIISAEQRRIQAGRQAQQRIDEIVDRTQTMMADRQAIQREIDNLVAFNTLLNQEVLEQERQLRELRASIGQVTIIERQILPLMTRMIDGLEQFIELDMPFFLNRRRARVTELRELLTLPEFSAADQFRRVMEAWQIEMDYGRYPDAYTGELRTNGTVREVDFLKIGRISFMYMTPDGSEAGAWDVGRGEWVPISREYHSQIRQGFEALGGDVSKAFFMIPITPPEEGT
jgi:hypothetical protein